MGMKQLSDGIAKSGLSFILTREKIKYRVKIKAIKMEVSLRKPQRLAFEIAKKHPGSFFRKYRKSVTAIREYFRLMTADLSPVKNFTAGVIKPLFDANVLTPVENGGGIRLGKMWY